MKGKGISPKNRSWRKKDKIKIEKSLVVKKKVKNYRSVKNISHLAKF